VEVEGRTERALLDRLKRACSPGTHVVALDAGGEALDSSGFARRLEAMLSSHQRVAFVVGDADGLPAGTDALVHERLSLSPMTLPHRLARLLLLEQIYRAFTIIRGEPYHR
jgi:23S rRNA (pseudouridine1915-N3)-methyltransferase